MSGNVMKLLSGGMLAAVVCCTCTETIAQQRGNRRNSPPVGNEQRDTGNNSQRAAALLRNMRTDAPKPYKEVITAKAVSYKSFLGVHKIEDKYYLEVPDALLGREILVVNRIGTAPAGFRNSRGPVAFGYAGDIIGELVFHFEKGEGNRLFMKTKSYKERSADSSLNGLARSLERNNMESIVNSFPVKAVNDSTHTTVIDITDMLSQDNILFGFASNVKNATGLGGIIADRSYVGGVKSDAENLSFSFMRTYNKVSGGGLGGSQLPYTFQLRCGMLLLPAVPMAARIADKRTAYQEIAYIDFDNNPLGVLNKGVIYRWRLEPSDVRAYQAGTPCTPVKPIQLYLDPAMPAKWKPFAKAGIEAWNTAFAKAGFVQAIQVKESTPADSSVFLDKLSHSAVVFMPGNGQNPGNIITDPRSGEILQVQLNFYLNTLNNLYKQYFIQAGALDKTANKPVPDDALMGRLVQAYTMQVMGRLLGLKVNAGASFANKIADLRNNNWLKTHAFNGSATDAMLVNYVVQPEDKVEVGNLLPKISETDEWMINWGYRVLPADETATLNKWIAARTAAGAEPYIGEAPRPGFNTASDPRNQVGDVGNDAVQAAILGISNLKRVVPRLLAWTSEPAEGSALAADMYEALLDQYTTYVSYVVSELGGLYINIRNSDQSGNVFSFVPRARQQKALQFLQDQVFTTPRWLINQELYARTGQCFDSVTNVQRFILGEVLSRQVLSKLQAAVQSDTADAYQPLVFLRDLRAGIFSELIQQQPVSLPRRELQRVYVSRLVLLTEQYAKADDDLPAVLRSHAEELLRMLQLKKAAYTGAAQAHVADLYERLYNGIHHPNNASPSGRRN